MTTTMQSNAQSIVTAWRAKNHEHVWGLPARDMLPSEINRMIAGTWDEIRRVIDHQADILAGYGFLPGLPLMGQLRGEASKAAHQAQRAHEWANALRDAELAGD